MHTLKREDYFLKDGWYHRDCVVDGVTYEVPINITPVKPAKKHNSRLVSYGWCVRLLRRDEPTHRKNFSNRVYGGVQQALDAATCHLRSVVSKYRHTDDLFGIPTEELPHKRQRFGVPGVSCSVKKKSSPAGHTTDILVIQLSINSRKITLSKTTLGRVIFNVDSKMFSEKLDQAVAYKRHWNLLYTNGAAKIKGSPPASVIPELLKEPYHKPTYLELLKEIYKQEAITPQYDPRQISVERLCDEGEDRIVVERVQPQPYSGRQRKVFIIDRFDNIETATYMATLYANHLHVAG